MPCADVVVGLTTSYRALVKTPATQLLLYQFIMGTDAVAENLTRTASMVGWWIGGIAVVGTV